MSQICASSLAPIQFTKLTSSAFTPYRASVGSAGFDLHSSSLSPITILPFSRVLIPTGLSFRFPPSVYGKIESRSGLVFNHGITVLAGVIDQDFEGEVGVILYNISTFPFIVHHGCRVAQLIPIPYVSTLDCIEQPTQQSPILHSFLTSPPPPPPPSTAPSTRAPTVTSPLATATTTSSSTARGSSGFGSSGLY